MEKWRYGCRTKNVCTSQMCKVVGHGRENGKTSKSPLAPWMVIGKPCVSTSGSVRFFPVSPMHNVLRFMSPSCPKWIVARLRRYSVQDSIHQHWQKIATVLNSKKQKTKDRTTKSTKVSPLTPSIRKLIDLYLKIIKMKGRTVYTYLQFMRDP